VPDTEFDKELISSNLLGAKTLLELQEKEKIVTHAKMVVLLENPIEGRLDYGHLKAIHYFLFSEVYTWAGKDRYEANITALFGKGTTHFTAYKRIPNVSRLLFGALKNEEYFKGQSRREFAKSSAIFMNGLNILHPFREGNGRVQRLFMEYLANHSGFELDFSEISSEEMILASVKGARGELRQMEDIFMKSLH